MAQQQHIIGLTEFLMTDGKVYRTGDHTVQLLNSFDHSKDFDEAILRCDSVLLRFPLSLAISKEHKTGKSGLVVRFDRAFDSHLRSFQQREQLFS